MTPFLFPIAPLIVSTLLAACSSAPPETADAPEMPTVVPAPAPASSQTEVVRLGRYTLVELTEEEAQRDPMRQIVVITIPPAFEATIGTAIQHVLARTGYRLCLPPPSLVHLPLPASHLHLGPMTLATALRTLAGPAWSLTVDHFERRICFERSPE